MANNKPAPRKWTDVQMTIAAVSMAAVLGFWNMFAGPDKEKAAEKVAAEQAKLIPTPTPTELPAPTAVAATMPPAGYTILFGGQAPQPQVIIQQSRGGGGGTGSS